MNFHLLRFEEQDLKLRIRTKDGAELEKLLGGPILGLLSNEQRVLSIMQDVPAMLFIALKPFAQEHGNYSYDDACELVDRMVDAGWSLEQFVELVIQIFEVSGLIPKGAVSAMKDHPTGP